MPAATREKPEEDKILVGNLIEEDHVNYVLMYNMLTGIRIGVNVIFCALFGAFFDNSLAAGIAL